ncbi:MAG: MFS transporter [Micavibrio sp.]
MHKTILSTWPLFFGVAMIMIGNGLQGTLLGVRATMEGFPTYSTGIIMSMYYAGFMLGSHFVPKLIQGVGHIRVFTALAAIASTTVLFHGMFPDEWVWGFVRAATGFAFAGMYIVIESWLNNAVDNKGRGKMMAFYLVVLYASMAIGQYMLGAADPGTMDLFIWTSVLISVAVLPISLSSRPAPTFNAPEKVSPHMLFKTSPLGIYGVFASGMASACLFAIGPVYAAEAGFTLPQIANFMAAAIIGAVALQFPIGWLSDKYDRRKILICVSMLAAIACGLALLAAPYNSSALYLAMFMLGGTALTIYGLSTAHTNDHLAPAQIVAASAGLIMINGIGSIIGPTASSALMNITGPWMLFAMMGAVYGSIAVFGIYRAICTAPVPMEQQDPFVPQASPSTALVMQQVVEQGIENLKSLDSFGDPDITRN